MKRFSLFNQLDGFTLLPVGWDGYSAQKIPANVITKAKEVAEWLPAFADGWQVVPGADGSVQFEKHADGFDIEIYVAEALK